MKTSGHMVNYLRPGQQKEHEPARCVVCGKSTIRRYPWRKLGTERLYVPICDAYSNQTVACYNEWLRPMGDVVLLRAYPLMGEFIHEHYGLGLEWSKAGRLRSLRDRLQRRFNF